MIANTDVPVEHFSANLSAADKTPPPLVPEKIPSLMANSLAVSTAAVPPTCRTLSKAFFSLASSTSLGMKSAAHPCS